MKLSVDKKRILEKLEKTNKVINTKAIVESQRHLFIKTIADKNLVVFRGVDGNTSSVTAILDKVEVAEDFIIAIEGRLLENMIKKMPDGNIDLIIKEGNKLNIKTETMNLKMKTIFDENMPDIEIDLDTNNNFTISKDKFIEQIEKVSFAVSTDESRPILNGVNLNYAGTDLKMVALDGYRIALSKMKMEKVETEDFDITIHNDFLKDAISILKKTESKNIKINFNDNKFMIKTKYLRLKTTLLHGDYVKYESIIEPLRSKDGGFVCKTDLIKNSLGRMAIVSNRDKEPLVLEINENEVELKVSSSNAKTSEKIKLNNTVSEKTKIGLNVNYLQDAIKHLIGDETKIKYTNALKPIYIGEEDLEFVIIPVRLTA